MTVLISEVLEEVRSNIASFTDVNVTVGSPVDSEPGLYVFAYMFSENSTSHNSPTNSFEGITDHGYIVGCLLMSSLPSDYVALDKGMRSLMEKPRLTSDERTIDIIMSSPSIDNLTRIFKSAGITLRLAIPFILRCTGNLNKPLPNERMSPPISTSGDT